MVRKAVRTYAQILTDFARADEEDARIRAFYEPSGARAAIRPSADPDAGKMRPVSAARKHRYANTLDWNDDVSAIVNVDKHDSLAPAGTLAAAFAADRKGTASRALTAALNCAIETASRLQHLPPAPATSHTSRLAMRLLRAAQAPLPVPASPSGSASVTPRAGMASSDDPHRPFEPGAASPGSRSPSRPSSPQSPGKTLSSAAGSVPAGSAFVPSGSANFDLQEQQQLAIACGTLLNSDARMLYYGSAKPRVSSGRARASGLSGFGTSRPASAPSQKSGPPSSSSSLPLGRASLTATWVPSPASAHSRPSSARPISTNLSVTGGSATASHRPASPSFSPSGRGAAVSLPRRATTASDGTPSFLSATVPASTSPPSSVRRSNQRSPFSGFVIRHTGNGEAAEVTPSVSVDTARSLGMNPRQLHQMQPKHGPSNGVVVRDPIGPQLVPNRRVAAARPGSAPPGSGPAAYDGGDGGTGNPELSTPVGLRGAAAQQQQARPPSPSWQPNGDGSSPPRQQQQLRNSSSPRRQAGSTSPQRGGMRRDESFRSAASAHTMTSTPSCGSVAVAAAAAAAEAAVSSGITLVRRRHAALLGARKALWSQIADAAGVAPYELQELNSGTLDGSNGGASGSHSIDDGSDSGPSLEAYLVQQAAVGPSSGSSSRAHSRPASPDHSSRPLLQHHHHPHRGTGANSPEGSCGMELSAAHLVASTLFSVSGTAADDVDTVGTVISEEVSRGSTALRLGQGSSSGDASLMSGRPGGAAAAHGSVLRVPSVIKRSQVAVSNGAVDNEGGGEAATTPNSAKRVQWGTNVWSPRHRMQSRGGAPVVDATADVVSELERDSSGIQVSAGGGEDRGFAGLSALPADPAGRPPRHPGLTPLDVGGDSRVGSGGGGGGELVFSGVKGNPMSSISPGLQGGIGSYSMKKRQPSRLQVERDLDDDSDLPSLEFSTAAGVLDRAAQSPRAAISGGGGGEGPMPTFTDPEFYFLTALVDRTGDVQGWLFNVYLTDITPGNPLARRVCIATCTTADEHKQLLVPPAPAARLRPSSSTSTSTSSGQEPSAVFRTPPSPPPLRPSPYTPLISPVELLPWINRPEQLFGHWLRLEAFSVVPLADKVVDAMTYMGRLDSDLTPPPQPKVSKLHVIDIRPAAAAAAHAAAAAAAATAAATAGIATAGAGFGGDISGGDGGSSKGKSRPSSASSVSTLAAALGRQRLSRAGNAAQVQARLVAEVGTPGRQRPASALVRGSPTWA